MKLVITITKNAQEDKDIVETHIDGDTELIKELQHIPEVRKQCNMDISDEMHQQIKDVVSKTKHE